MSVKWDAELRLRRDRRREMYEMHEQRVHTLKAIGKRFGVGPKQVRINVDRHKKLLDERKRGNMRLNRQSPEGRGRRSMTYIDIGVRAANCLLNSNITCLEDLTYFTEAELLRVPNFGRESLARLRAECVRVGYPIGWNRDG